METLSYQLQGEGVSIYKVDVTNEELSSRLLTDYFVKAGVVYENMGGYEGNDGFIIEILELSNEKPYENVDQNVGNHHILDYRFYHDQVEKRELIKRLEYPTISEIVPRLLLFKPRIDGKTYSLLSGEWDEDRKVFTVYLKSY